ncbi:MAG TPA: glycoside hydrolase family 3 N-terminal domain-containing protein [Vicinamibacteria bacterium]|nr:glycoside hydrolase family 3 N-terminal domain-containing protein [Vicinamibacteria bacterium]
MSGRRLLVAALAAATVACRRPGPPAAPDAPPSPQPALRWAKKTLAGLSLEEKTAQLVGVRVSGVFRNARSPEAKRTAAQVAELGVGSLVAFESDVETLPRVLNDLQQSAKVPLLVASDFERGVAFRIRRGVAPLPYAMAIGATRSVEAARFSGEVTAREARALGVHWTFAPVADVNNNPANPIINIRSFGEDPEQVARLSAAFIQGARAGGLLTTAKHFPGHGDTGVDSHLQVASIHAGLERLRAVELLPFRRDLDAGVDAVMLGHIAVPALDPSGVPASQSAPVGRFLREELGFAGLVVTDAIEMAGARAAWSGEAVVRAVKAGADVVLLPPDPAVAVAALVRAVREGELPAERVEAAALRVLEAKERLGLDRQRLVETKGLATRVGRPEDVERAFALARDSITLLRNDGGVLPLRSETRLRVLHLVLSSDVRNELIQGYPEDELEERRIPTETRAFGPEVSEETAAELAARAGEFTHVVVSAFVRVGASKGTADMSPSHARLIRDLSQSGTPVVVVSFGSPYLLRQFPEVAAYLCAYGGAESSQRAAIGALFGEFEVHGRLPVTLPGLYAYGHGLTLPRRAMSLRTAPPEEVGFRSSGLADVDRVVEAFLADKAYPGAVLAVGRDSALVRLKAFGRLSYDEGAPDVEAETLYDLASLTKVVVGATMAMILVDEGRLDIEKPLSAFLPRFRGGAKDRVAVRHLLTHSAGLEAVAPLYKELSGKAAYLDRIQKMDLVYEPDAKSVYSDLGEILLGEVLERVAGESLDAFARRRILDPLGMKDTLFRPGAELHPRIAPTEDDPWRGRVLRGEVHDENAFAMGGVSAHAGLFGTAPDLARFAQMMLNGGVYDHRRIVSRETVERFTRRAGIAGSSRALGWDTPSPGSSAGSLLSPSSFGHTGFTGTSLWIDPERQLFVILLTNRVHPTRANDAVPKVVRAAVADAVVRALDAP